MKEIYQLNVTPEERAECIQRVQDLFKIHRGKHYTQGNMNRIFTEMESMMRRLKEGGKLIEEAQASGAESKVTQAHLHALSDLFYLLTRMVGIYELFLNESFPPEDVARHSKVQVRLQQICALYEAS